MARRWTVAAVTCLATALLAGCSGGTQQASTTLPTTSAPAAAASPTLPPLGPPDFPVPAEARAKTPEGVTAFTNYYIALINRGVRSLDAQPMLELSRQCQTCSELADSVEKAKQAAQKFEGGDLTVVSTGTSVVEGDSGDVSFYLRESTTVVRDAGGSPVPGRRREAGAYTGGLKVTWDAARVTWLVTQFDADKV